MARSIDDITHDLLTDRRPGADGCSNADRAYFVAEVMGCAQIDLNDIFDFQPVIQCKNPEVVEAAKHIAILQMDFLKRASENDLLAKDIYEVKTADLILAVQRINWHQMHLAKGQRTPPFPFIH